MASMVAKVSGSISSQVLPAMPVQEKGSRNKRKFWADTPLGDTTKISLPQDECSTYKFSSEKFEITPVHRHSNGCDMCSISQDRSDALKLDLELSTAAGPFEVVPIQYIEEVEAANEVRDADWSDLTESQLEELVLSNLDAIFRSAIKKIVAYGYGYSEQVAEKAVLRSGVCYGSKDAVSNIVDNTLAFLSNGMTCFSNGQEIDLSREICFEDLQQMEKYILAELVCVLREVKPFFSTGDAMWCLLICDMNVSHACAMDGDPSGTLSGDGGPNRNDSFNIETRSSGLDLTIPCKPDSSIACAHCSQSGTPRISGVPNFVKAKSSNSLNVLVQEKESSMPTSEEKLGGSRKISGISKREYILRQKSLHLEKCYRTYSSKGSSRPGKLSAFGGLMLDKKLKSVSDSIGANAKKTSLKISKTKAQTNGYHTPPTNSGLPSSVTFNSEAMKSSVSSTLPTVSIPVALSAADTELSLSLPTQSSNVEVPNCSYSGIPYDKSTGKWVPQDKKDEVLLKLLQKVRELQNQIEEWTEWANQKVSQATRRLSKDKVEIKSLRQEREEVERIKREKQTLEENTMKKLSEMENALAKASGQVERANGTVRRLEVENVKLRLDMEDAKLRAAKSAASCQEASKKEKKTLKKFFSWEKQQALFQEELVAEKRKLAQLLLELGQAKDAWEQLEARWKREEKAKEELLNQASSIRKEREQYEASAKSKENATKLKAETNLQRYKDDIRKLEKEISQLRLETDSSKIAALKRGIDGIYANRLVDVTNFPKESQVPSLNGTSVKFQEYSGMGGVKRERECVMCLSEEMSVVFLPCAHQVVCTTCNELHEKQGMKECPSCRGPIQQRVSVRYARA